MKNIVFVTDAESLPIDYDMEPLLAACANFDLPIEIRKWDDPTVDWAAFDLVVLRSPWSYASRLEEFLRWCRKVSKVTRLENPLAVIEWSLDKHYLSDLADANVPVVPTLFVEPHATGVAGALADFKTQQQNCPEVVVKPSVGAYSKDVKRFKAVKKADILGYIQKLNRQGDSVLIQPYLSSIDLVGETDLIFFNGQYSHAIRKGALLAADGTVNVPTSDFRKEREPDETEIAIASKALKVAADKFGLERPLLYARVDLVRDIKGDPVVLEMEIAEPSLSLPNCRGSAIRFAHALNEMCREDELVSAS